MLIQMKSFLHMTSHIENEESDITIIQDNNKYVLVPFPLQTTFENDKDAANSRSSMMRPLPAFEENDDNSKKTTETADAFVADDVYEGNQASQLKLHLTAR